VVREKERNATDRGSLDLFFLLDDLLVDVSLRLGTRLLLLRCRFILFRYRMRSL